LKNKGILGRSMLALSWLLKATTLPSSLSTELI
jgi:hypothetical protein